MLRLIFSFLLFLVVSPIFAGVLTLDGHFYGSNLFVQNPFGASGVGFCAYEVTVNGKTTTDEVNSSAFEIDLKFLQLEPGAKVEIKIKHKDDCKPKVINPEALKPMSTYEVVSMKVDNSSTFNFSTKNESGKLTFHIEQFRWNKWVQIGEVEGKGKTSAEANQYSFSIGTIHSGENKFRLKQIDNTGKPRYSSETKFRSTAAPVSWAPGEGKKATDAIKFSEKTMYEIYNSFGNIVDKGVSDRVEISKLDKGTFYLNYDNSTGTFKK